MNTILNKTLSSIVTENYQAAKVFEKYGLDFCCKGKKPLADACNEKKLNADDIVKELNEVLTPSSSTTDFTKMSLTELAEYIVRVHHNYVKINSPQILEYLQKVATKHGDRYPYMKEVYLLLSEVKDDMEQHMLKEEKTLFPRIKLLELNAQQSTQPEYLQAPINVMEAEHDHAGTLLQRIRELTNNYTADEGMCTTFRLTLTSLQAFEEDLHQHVHLENNILFPKSIELLKKVKAEVITD